MKKRMFALLFASLLCCSCACSSQNMSDNIPSDIQTVSVVSESVSKTDTEEASETESRNESEKAEESTDITSQTDPEIQKLLDEYVDDYEFEGVIYAEKDGSPYVSFAIGELENGDEISVDTPMPVGSVSKQVCAAAVLLLRDQGKLSVDDMIDKYFHDYPQANKITVADLLSMRAGIPEMTADGNEDLVSVDKTEAENVAAIKKWVFAQPLSFEPGKRFEYVNTNYFLLSDIVSQVSGEKYVDFLRSNFFEPLGMTHTGVIGELDSSPKLANVCNFQQLDRQPGLTNGCGDIISNAADMKTWIKALASGKVISEESYKAMTTSYSDEQYGYGMYTSIKGGVGHYGAIGIYSAFDYINVDNDFVMIVFSDSVYPPRMTGLSNDLIDDLM